MILIIDNYDSFTYNIFQYVGEINKDVIIVKNDELSIESIKESKLLNNIANNIYESIKNSSIDTENDLFNKRNKDL